MVRRCVVAVVVLCALGITWSLAAGVFLGLGTVSTSGSPPVVTKSGTLVLVNHEDIAITNARATLQPSDMYTIARGTVSLPDVTPGGQSESTGTYALQVDLSKAGSRHLGLRWVVQFDQAGETRSIELATVLTLTELE